MIVPRDNSSQWHLTKELETMLGLVTDMIGEKVTNLIGKIGAEIMFERNNLSGRKRST